jgi:hypothetical protein
VLSDNKEQNVLGNSDLSTLFRRTSTFALTILVGAFVVERAIDEGGDAIFDHINRGVIT